MMGLVKNAFIVKSNLLVEILSILKEKQQNISLIRNVFAVKSSLLVEKLSILKEKKQKMAL